MSGIRSKISSIEADDDVVSKALGLHPVEESKPLEPIAPTDEEKITRAATKSEENSTPMPAIVSRPAPSISTISNEPARWPLYLLIGFSLLWLVGTIIALSSLYSFAEISNYSASQLGGVAFLVLFPLLMMGVAYYAFRQLSKVTHRAERLEQAADALMRVDETVVRRATEMAGVVKGEIDTLNTGIDTALTRVSTLESVIHEQTEKLGETSLSVEDKTQRITERLSTEREALWSISNTFDEQMKVLTESLDTHSENLAMSTKTAEQKIQEARISVENTASKINQTSDLIRNNTMEAATTLSGNQDEILKLSDQLKQRASELDTIYQKHGQDLNAMIAQLKNEQEALNKSLEERLSKMRDVALSAQVSAERLTEASEAGRQTVMSLSEASQMSENVIQKRFSDLEEMVQLSNAKAETINEKAARRVQDSLAQTRKEIAQIETDMMDLQARLTSASQTNVEANSLAVETEPVAPIEPTQPSELDVPAKKTFGSLNLRPVEDAQSAEPIQISATAAEPDDIVPDDTDSDASPKLRLRPVSETPSAPDSEASVSLFSDPEKADIESTPNLDLNVEQPTVLRSSVTESDNVSKSWWKNLFGKSDDVPAPRLNNPMPVSEPLETPSQPAPSAITPAPVAAAVASAAAAMAPMASQQVFPMGFVSELSKNGLAPNAIVDNGCVVEAVENRISNGTKAMSIGVATRLGEPVRHFSRLMEQNQTLKSDVINFAVKFHHSLSDISDNRNALQDRFDTEEGRLFLMCDAALNS